MPWNPEQYHKFQSERSAPFYDLLKLVDVRSDIKVVVLYLERLGEHRAAFLDVLGRAMRKALPDGPLLYPFRRTFFSARRLPEIAEVK
jgi:trans-aconitate methyltransferase